MYTKANQQLESIAISQLSDVTGGGLLGGALKLVKKAGPLVEKAAPFIKHKAVDAAKWGVMPAFAGGGIAWAKHQFTR